MPVTWMRCRDNVTKHSESSPSSLQGMLLTIVNFTQSRVTWEKENKTDELFQSDGLYACL